MNFIASLSPRMRNQPEPCDSARRSGTSAPRLRTNRRNAVHAAPGRATRVLGTFVLVVGLSMTLGTRTAEARDVGYEGTVHHGINDVRRPDAWFGRCVDQQAEKWARHMAATRSFHHSDIRATLRQCNARWVGEIIGWGLWSPHDIIQAWLHSPTHRSVMLNRVYRRMGVASVPYGRHGERATVVQFITH